MNKWKNWKIQEILRSDDKFPNELKKLRDCPKKLYYRGAWNSKLFSKTLSIVGSRRMTRYGKEVVSKFMPELVAGKITIVSGFMYGVDSEAHRKCLEVGGKTIAILGSGLDYLTPVENGDLYTEILKNDGLVISEYEPDFQPTLWSFPQRNRIVSGLSTVGVLIIEAGIKSGSLITAKIGRKQNKNIFAVPGPITSSASIGTNWLLEHNLAKIVTDPSVLTGERKGVFEQMVIFDTSIDPQYRKILELLRQESLTIDELARGTEMNIAEISVLISQMIMKGMIEEEGGKLFTL